MTVAVDRVRAEAAVHDLLAAWGIAPDDPRIVRTAARVAEASAQMLAGEGVDPVPLLRDGRIAAPDSGLVLLRNIRFSSLCEHHLLPFDGWVHLAYQPGDSIVGFGRLYDLVSVLAGRLTLQERLGEDLVDALMLGLDARGALAVIEASQGCVTARGPRQHDSDAVTVAARGGLVGGEERAEAFRCIALAGDADREPYVRAGASADANDANAIDPNLDAS